MSAVLIQIPFAQAYTGTITYSAGTDTITAVGGNSTVPITFDDLYLADVAGGWGQIIKQGSNQYLMLCKLILGNGTTAGTTFFNETQKQICFNGSVTVANDDSLIYVRAYATATFGKVTNYANKVTVDGVSFIDKHAGTEYYSLTGMESTNSIVYHHGTHTENDYTTSHEYRIQGTRFWNCLFDRNTEIYVYQGGPADVYNSIMANPRTGIYLRSASGTTVNKLSVMNGLRCIYFLFNGTTFQNLYGRGATGDSIYMNQVTGSHAYLIDADLDAWTFGWSGTSTKNCYRQYTYDLTVLNGEITDFVEDANVTLSKGGVQIGTWLTNSSGQIETQTLTYGYYNQTGDDTMYDGSYPFVLTVTHEDWADYTSRFYVTEKTKMSISMQDETTANNAALIWSLLFGALAFALFLAWRVRR